MRMRLLLHSKIWALIAIIWHHEMIKLKRGINRKEIVVTFKNLNYKHNTYTSNCNRGESFEQTFMTYKIIFLYYIWFSNITHSLSLIHTSCYKFNKNGEKKRSFWLVVKHIFFTLRAHRLVPASSYFCIHPNINHALLVHSHTNCIHTQ